MNFARKKSKTNGILEYMFEENTSGNMILNQCINVFPINHFSSRNCYIVPFNFLGTTNVNVVAYDYYVYFFRTPLSNTDNVLHSTKAVRCPRIIISLT